MGDSARGRPRHVAHATARPLADAASMRLSGFVRLGMRTINGDSQGGHGRCRQGRPMAMPSVPVPPAGSGSSSRHRRSRSLVDTRNRTQEAPEAWEQRRNSKCG